MAGKEATVYIVDLGASMGKKHHGREHTDLDWALDYVWDKITTTVCRRSFGDLVRDVLLLRRVKAQFAAVRTRADDGAGSDRPENGANECRWMSYR